MVSSRVRHGTTVLPQPDLTAAERRARLDAAAQGFARTATALETTPDDAAAAVRRAMRS